MRWTRRREEQREREITRGIIDVAAVKAEVSVLISEIIRNLDRIQEEVDGLSARSKDGDVPGEEES